MQKLSQAKKFFLFKCKLTTSNLGYHSLRKYNNDVLVINENELRHELETGKRDKNIRLETFKKIENTNFSSY